MKPFNAYKKFVTDRDRALENIFLTYRLQIASVLSLVFKEIKRAFLLPPDQRISWAFIDSSAYAIEALINEMRKEVYELSFASELEICARLMDKKTKAVVDYNLTSEMDNGGSPKDRIVFYLRRLVRRLETRREQLMLNGENLTAEEIDLLLPRKEPISKRVVLKKVKENDPKKKKIDLGVTLLSPENWDNILNRIAGQESPIGRSSMDRVLLDGEAGDTIYAWEFERDLTQDFVDNVRRGQLSGAKQLGITDFVWIAILDNRTDECCEWRDGLTTSEIEHLLKTKRKNDECKAVTPPAHFNCRCTLAPATDKIPDVPASNIGEFQDWLNS